MDSFNLPGLDPVASDSVSYLHQMRCLDGYRIGYCGLMFQSNPYYRTPTDRPTKCIYSLKKAREQPREAPLDIGDERSMWLDFARIKKEQDMITFANKYGLLEAPTLSRSAGIHLRKNSKWGGDWQRIQTLARREWAKEHQLSGVSDDELEKRCGFRWFDTTVVSAEPVDVWEAHLSEIQPLVRIYDAIRNERISALKQMFRWIPEGAKNVFAFRYKPSGREFLITKKMLRLGSESNEAYEKMSDLLFDVGTGQYGLAHVHPEMSAEFKNRGDYVTPAKMYLTHRVNWHLKDRTGIAIIHSQNDLSLQELRIVPDNLISAIWYEFSNSIAAGSEIKRCSQCTEFYVRRNKRGSEQRYCSNACKTKSYRMRKARAVA